MFRPYSVSLALSGFLAQNRLSAAPGAAGFALPFSAAARAPSNAATNAATARIGRELGLVDRDIAKLERASIVLGAAQGAISAISDLLFTASAAAISAQGIVPSGATTSSPATGTGTVALAADVAASGSGALVLQPVSQQGTVDVGTDVLATATGTADVASSTNLTGDTSLSLLETMTVDVGGDVTTITFGVLGGQVNTAAELEAALDAIAGVEASYNGSGALVITGETLDDSFTIGGTADIEAAFGIVEQAYAPSTLLTRGFVQGTTLTFQVNADAVQTITFGTGAGEVDTVAELSTALAGVTGLNASLDGSNRLTYTALNNDDTVTVGGTADLATRFGITAGSLDPDNLLQQGITAGQTLTFQVGAEAVQTITFGTGVGEVETVGDLNTALGDLTGLTASIDGADTLSFTAATARDDVVVGGTADLAGVLGLTPQTYQATNLLDRGLSQGETLTFQVGAAAVQTVTFGTGASEIATLAELDAALAGLTGLAASLDAQNALTFTADTNDDPVTVGGTADTATVFGLAAGQYDPTVTAAPQDEDDGTATPADLLDDYNAALNAIDGAVSDARYRGLNLLDGGQLEIRAAGSGERRDTVGPYRFSLADLGLALLDQGAFDDNTQIQQYIDAIDAARDKLRHASTGIDAAAALAGSRDRFADGLSGRLEETSSRLKVKRLSEAEAREVASTTRRQLAGQARLALAQFTFDNADRSLIAAIAAAQPRLQSGPSFFSGSALFSNFFV